MPGTDAQHLIEVPLQGGGSSDEPSSSLSRRLHESSDTMDNASLSEVKTTIASITMQSLKESVSFAASHWKVVLFGQVLSFILACNGASQATLHFECSLSAPTFTSGLFYLVLSLHAVPLYLKGVRVKTRAFQDSGLHRATQEDQMIEGFSAPHWFGNIPLYATSAWRYFGIAFLDVEANYLTVLAYKFTTLTSVTLFDALAIPSCIILSRIFLKRQYTKLHMLGVTICMWGIVYNVLADYETASIIAAGSKEARQYPRRLLGDFLAILGGILYGANDVLAEKYVKLFGSQTEFLAMIGIFGSVISLLQALILERSEIFSFFTGKADENDDGTCSVGMSVGLLLAYVLSSTLTYVGMARFVLVSEATLLNLSLLTADLWSVMFSVIAESIVPSLLFWVALTMIVSGVTIYEMDPSPIVPEEESYYPDISKRGSDGSDDQGTLQAGLRVSTSEVEVL